MEVRRNPRRLQRAEGIKIISDIIDRLYVDIDHDGVEFYNPDKQWDADVLEAVKEVLEAHNLIPTQPCNLKGEPYAPIN